MECLEAPLLIQHLHHHLRRPKLATFLPTLNKPPGPPRTSFLSPLGAPATLGQIPTVLLPGGRLLQTLATTNYQQLLSPPSPILRKQDCESTPNSTVSENCDTRIYLLSQHLLCKNTTSQLPKPSLSSTPSIPPTTPTLLFRSPEKSNDIGETITSYLNAATSIVPPAVTTSVQPTSSESTNATNTISDFDRFLWSSHHPDPSSTTYLTPRSTSS